jgi:hypothetical protein
VVTDGSWASWVEFQEFGTAAQDRGADRSRSQIGNTFHIEFGQRIYATTFAKLTLVDDEVVNAAINNLPKPSSPNGNIGGTLGGTPTTGRFDFDLERGQGAQFFP